MIEKKTQKDYTKKYTEKINENPELKYKQCEECGEQYYYSNFSKHKKTKIHIAIVKKLNSLNN
jgi:YgiT-type zinc finger domain-containing protein